MFLPPIIEREMRVALRAPGALKPRFWAAGAGTLAAIFFLFLSMAYGESVWRTFHKPLFGVALYLAVVRPAQHAAGLFAEERRNQTLGLIYLTGIGSLELFVTKFFGGLLIASSELLALLPFIALPFLSGGVSLEMFLATAACLPTLLMFTISVTVMVSILCTDESHALAWIAVVIGMVSLATPLIHALGMVVAGAPPFAKTWLALSPAYAPYLVFSKLGAGSAKLFWLTIAITWGWALLFILTAAWLLPRHWRDDPDGGLWLRLKSHYSDWLQRARSSARLRALLEANPFQWLVERNRSADAAWTACAGIIVLWLLAWAVWRGHWPSPANFFVTACALVLFVDMFQMNAPAQQIATHRRDGIFELLLTTSLRPKQIVDGLIQGSISEFRAIRRTLCGVFATMAISGLVTRAWNWRALVSYLLIWSVLIVWASGSRRRSLPMIIWVALNSGRGAWAVMKVHGSRSFLAVHWILIMSLIHLSDLFKWFGSGAAAFPTGSDFELGIFAFVAILAIIIKTKIGETPRAPELYPRLISEMRSIAEEPVPSPKDPRLRRWNIEDRLPD